MYGGHSALWTCPADIRLRIILELDRVSELDKENRSALQLAFLCHTTNENILRPWSPVLWVYLSEETLLDV